MKKNVNVNQLIAHLNSTFEHCFEIQDSQFHVEIDENLYRVFMPPFDLDESDDKYKCVIYLENDIVCSFNPAEENYNRALSDYFQPLFEQATNINIDTYTSPKPISRYNRKSYTPLHRKSLKQLLKCLHNTFNLCFETRDINNNFNVIIDDNVYTVILPASKDVDVMHKDFTAEIYRNDNELVFVFQPYLDYSAIDTFFVPLFDVAKRVLIDTYYRSNKSLVHCKRILIK